MGHEEYIEEIYKQLLEYLENSNVPQYEKSLLLDDLNKTVLCINMDISVCPEREREMIDRINDENLFIINFIKSWEV